MNYRCFQTFPLTFNSFRDRAWKFKEYTKKRAAGAKFVASLFKPTTFLTFLLLSPLLFLNFPGFTDVSERLEIRLSF